MASEDKTGEMYGSKKYGGLWSVMTSDEEAEFFMVST